MDSVGADTIFEPDYSSHTRTPSWGSSIGQTLGQSSIDIDIELNSLLPQPNSPTATETVTLSGFSGQPIAPPPRPLGERASHRLLKSLLVVCGLASIAQYALAIALICHPGVFNSAIQDNPKSSLVSFLPAIANITNKTAEGWLAAAAALIGLIAWEPHLTTRGTSLAEMEAWGSVLSKDLPSTLLNLRRLDVVPLVVFLAAIGLTAAAMTAVTNAVTPFPGSTEHHRNVTLPSLFVADPRDINWACAPDAGSGCWQNTQRG